MAVKATILVLMITLVVVASAGLLGEQLVGLYCEIESASAKIRTG